MFRYLIPRIALADLPPMLGAALIGALIAGAYGILHDQITYTISPEYFAKLKFKQFHFADFGLGDRIFVSCIGVLATWWVGFIIGWFLARYQIPDQTRKLAYRKILTSFVIVFASGILTGAAGYGFGLYRGPNADYSNWLPVVRRFDINDIYSFVRVAYIHNASYFGGLLGFIVSLIVIRPRR